MRLPRIDCMAREETTTTKEVWGQLVDVEGNPRLVKLRLVWEQAQIRESVQLVSGITVEDGNYTLRYSFDGKQKEPLVRVVGGDLLAR